MKDFGINDFDVVDSEFDDRTGEELYAEFMENKEKSRDEFVYYYGGYFSIMTSLTASASSLLTWLVFNCEVNTGRVVIQSYALKDLMKELSINHVTYYKALKLLKSLDAIRGKSARYYVNPAFAWKGSADKRMRFMKIYPKL